MEIAKKIARMAKLFDEMDRYEDNRPKIYHFEPDYMNMKDEFNALQENLKSFHGLDDDYISDLIENHIG